jgi:hypothetical protein
MAPDLTCAPPRGPSWHISSHLDITSYTQLEALFALWNAAQLRSPLSDSACISRSSKFRQNRSSRSFATKFTQRKSWGFSVRPHRWP